MILLTGGTGALGRELAPLLASIAREEVVVLTRDPYGAPARSFMHGVRGIRFVQGDILSGPSLGMDAADAATLRAEVTRVVHCAAATAFSLPLAEARRVNVDGTKAVLDFAATCKRPASVACASTAYVAGTRTGVIHETHDVIADAWVNSYEQSKSEMETLARKASSALPVSIYRFSTIIGHSETGVVTGFNAIHHSLRLLYQGLAPMVPGHLTTHVDFIPVDYAARAFAHLLTQPSASARTYHICAGADRTCSFDELLTTTIEVFERTRPAWRKRRLARPAVVDAETYALFTRSVVESGNVVLQRATEAVQAFAWQLAYPKTFDTSVTAAALAGSGIVTPRVHDYYDKVVRFCVETNWGRAASDRGVA
jgi:nucleoside-diphosphate-sugar epimerase